MEGGIVDPLGSTIIEIMRKQNKAMGEGENLRGGEKKGVSVNADFPYN